MSDVVAMVLAGGRGKRMDILCQWRPKPVLPFGGRYRVIDFGLSNCINSGIKTIAALVDYRRDEISDYLLRWHSANNAGGSLSLLRPRSGSFLGTADAVFQNLDFLARENAEDVLVLAGDHIYQMDYRKMLAFHRATGADVTVGVVEVPVEEARRFGTVRVDGQNQVTEFVEKSPNPCSTLASMGIYIFNRRVLSERLCEDAAKPNSPHDFGYAILPGMVQRDRVFAYRFDGYWQDIGTIEAYYQSNMELLGSNSGLHFDSSWPIMTEKNALPECQIGEQGTVINSIISPGCVINGHVENSILSPGVRVDEKAEVRDSLVMANARVGYHSVVSRSVLDEGVSVGKFCYVGFGVGYSSGNGEITVLGKEVQLPPNTAVGRRCKIMPHAGPAAFPARVVPSGSTVFCLEPTTASA